MSRLAILSRPAIPSRPRAAAAALALGLLVATPVSAAAPDGSLPPPRTAGVPVPAGQIAQASEAIDGLARALVDTTGIPGLAVAVVHEGRTIHARGYGVRKVGGSEPVDADTVFQVASLSKSLAATVVAQRVGIGAVSWDTPVRKYLPGFALADPWVTTHVTIADLFTHRSGLPDHAGDDLEDMGYRRGEILERLRLLALGPFRAGHRYTNFGLTAAAEAVARQAGQDWASLAETTLFGPLGMSRTSFRLADYLARENRAAGHVPVDGRFVAGSLRDPDPQAPAGGASSSVRDMARWMALVLGEGRLDGRELVAPAALIEALSPQSIARLSGTADGRAGFYGYGFNVATAPSGRVIISHSGAFALGAATSYLLIPSLDVGIVVLSNAAPIGAVEALGQQFADLVQFGTVTRDWLDAYAGLFAPLLAPFGSLVGVDPPADPAPPRDARLYAGTYTNAYFGPIRIERDDGELALRVGPAGLRYRLDHRDGDLFTFEPSGENANPGSVSAVRFEMAEDEREGAAAVTIEFLDQEGWGRFERVAAGP